MQPLTTRPANAVPAKKRKKQTVSASATFKQRHNAKKPTHSPTGGNIVRPATPHPDAKRKRDPHAKTQLGSVVFKPQNDTHPIVKEFNEITQTYQSTVVSANQSLLQSHYTRLLAKLHNQDQITMLISSQSPSQTQPMDITAAYELSVRRLTSPLADVQLELPSRDKDGNKVMKAVALGDRMRIFAELIAQSEQRMNELRLKWEEVVREIYHVGVSVLSEEGMLELLGFAVHAEEQALSSEEDEERLFVSSDGDDGDDDARSLLSAAAPSKPKKQHKKVTFEPLPPPQIPEFLTKPSIYRPVRAMPELPVEEVEELERTIDGIGDAPLDELKKVVKAGEAAWRKKQVQIAEMLAVE